MDFVNLGFRGNGRGEPELAAAVSEIDACCYVIDFWANVPADQYGARLPGFVGAIRESHPKTPIVVVTPFFYAQDAVDDSVHARQRKDAKAFVKKRQRQGDENIHLLDGSKLISREETYAQVDGVHPNTLGFYLIAKGFTPRLKRILAL